MKNNFCILFALFCFTYGNAQKVIPFRLTESNNIIVKALVNEKDSLNLMFQIAMENGSISPERINKVNHILFDENEVSNGNKVQIEGLVWKNVPFQNNELSGQGSDGKIGTILFKDKMFKIDYDKSEFVIYENTPDLKDYVSIPLTFKYGVMFIDVDNKILNEQYVHSFYLQSGYSGGLLYDNQFSDENKLSEKLITTNEKTLKNSAGQTLTTKEAVLDEMNIGGFSIKNVSVGYFVGELKTQNLSIFGADLLKRFNWIIDAERKIAYIKPSKFFNSENSN